MTAPSSDIGCTTCMVDVDHRRSIKKESLMSGLLRRSLVLPAMVFVIVLSIFLFVA